VFTIHDDDNPMTVGELSALAPTSISEIFHDTGAPAFARLNPFQPGATSASRS
jgi:hypothetical protein